MKTQFKFTGPLLGFLSMTMLALLINIVMLNSANSHELRPSVADFKLLSDDTYQINIQVNVEALISKIGAEHSDTEQSTNAGEYNKLRASSSDEVVSAFGVFKTNFLSNLEIYFDGVRTMPTKVFLQVPEIGDVDLARDSIIIVSGKLPKGATDFQWLWPGKYGASVIRTAKCCLSNTRFT